MLTEKDTDLTKLHKQLLKVLLESDSENTNNTEV